MSDFDVSNLSGFEGYVAGKLDGIENEIKGIRETITKLPCKEQSDKINAISNKVSNIEGKATMFGAIAGLLAGLFKGVFWPK